MRHDALRACASDAVEEFPFRRKIDKRLMTIISPVSTSPSKSLRLRLAPFIALPFALPLALSVAPPLAPAQHHHGQKHQHRKRAVNVERHAPDARHCRVDGAEMACDEDVGGKRRLVDEIDHQPCDLPPFDPPPHCKHDHNDNHA
jgi:hypothetical protein